MDNVWPKRIIRGRRTNQPPDRRVEDVKRADEFRAC